MIGAFSNLTEKQQDAVVYLTCYVVTANNNGILDMRKQFSDLSIIFDECFGWDLLLDFEKVREATMRTRQCCCNICFKELVKISDNEKQHLISIINRLVNGSVERLDAANEVIEGLSRQRDVLADDNGVEELNEPLFARLVDVSCIRESAEIFNISSEDKGEISAKCTCEYWMSRRYSPRAGLVGFIPKQVETQEGTLCFLVCASDLVIPVLKRGLEMINIHQYMMKAENNKILSFFMG